VGYINTTDKQANRKWQLTVVK